MLAAAVFALPGTATAGPREVCAAAQVDFVDGKWDQQHPGLEEAIVQGYCSFSVVIIINENHTTTTTTNNTNTSTSTTNNTSTTTNTENNTTTTPEVCVEVAPNTPGAVQAPNGKWYTGPNAHQCGPAVAQPQVCVEVAAGTQGAVQAPNGKWYTGPDAHLCGPAAPVVQPAPPAQPQGGALPGEKTIVSKPQPSAQPQAAPQAAGVAGQQSPLAQTRSTGTLPFTGAELVIFAIVGAALLGAGLLLRLSSRQRESSS